MPVWLNLCGSKDSPVWLDLCGPKDLPVWLDLCGPKDLPVWLDLRGPEYLPVWLDLSGSRILRLCGYIPVRLLTITSLDTSRGIFRDLSRCSYVLSESLACVAT